MAANLQNVFTTSEFGSSRNLRNSCVLFEGGKNKNTKPRGAKALLPFRMHVRYFDKKKELAFVRYMDVSPSRDDVGRALRFERLRWSTDEDIDYTLAQRDRSTKAKELKTVEQFGADPFRSIKSTIHVMRENFDVVPCYEETPWPSRRFCTNRFYKAFSKQL